ncbi:MAG: hypothetical protein LUG56_10780 [Lachnospiraceae bacterium]|nr:hypothetical protein [Lachnospiraceae bacterium]
MDKIQQLADYIEHSSMVAITGAGISLAGGGITYGQLFSKTILRGVLGRERKVF